MKPGEAHPTDRIAAIDAELARRGEAEKLAAEEEAERLRQQALADSLAAEAERLAEMERQREADAAAFEEKYLDVIAKADAAYDEDQLDRARTRYSEALEMKPEEAHPKERIAAINAELERRRQAELEADALAAEQARLEEDRLRREQAAADSLRLAQEEEDRLRDQARAHEQQYQDRVIAADEAFGRQAYDEARGLYAEAADLKPEEIYPISKIEQIDLLLAELEKQRQEAELAAQRAAERKAPAPRNKGRTIDTRKEQEAEQFMRAAREREESEKYDRIRKFRSDLQESDAQQAERASERRMADHEQNQRLMEPGAGLYAGDDALARKNTEELEAYREALARAEAARAARARDARTSNYEAKLDQQDQSAASQRTWDQRHADRSAQAAAEMNALMELRNEQEAASADRGMRQQKEAQAIAQGQQRMQQRGAELAAANAEQADAQKRAHQVREAGYARAQQNRAQENMQVNVSERAGGTHAFAELKRSKLAREYPQGVTEESYTEGNKVIIRRVVVNGDRADEYSKVIAKWGIFYFKNGHSISEAVWGRETEG